MIPEFAPVGEGQLLVDVAEVVFDGLGADEQFLADLLIGKSSADEMGDLPLSGAEFPHDDGLAGGRGGLYR